MARLASQEKAGFYPTPDIAVEMIMTYLGRSENEGLIRIYDPCCGYGKAVKSIGEYLNAETYGVELEREKAKVAQETLTKALRADAFRVSARKESFSLLFLNPPYDYDAGESKRLEHLFLLNNNERLMPSGILVYLIPQYSLRKNTAKVLANWYDDVSIMRFPDDEYGAFRQIVVFGKKKKKCNVDADIYQKLV